MKVVQDEETKRFSGYRAAIRNIKDNLSTRDRVVDLMVNRLYRCILRGEMAQAGILDRAIRIVFPKGDVAIADARFRALWKLRKYAQAIRVYRQIGRMFWHAEAVGRYYERRGQMSRAVVEYEYLVSEYNKMRKNFLPLPSGPRELFVLAKWFADKDKIKARAYLTTYLSAEKVWSRDPAFRLRHKVTAAALLSRLRSPLVHSHRK